MNRNGSGMAEINELVEEFRKEAKDKRREDQFRLLYLAVWGAVGMTAGYLALHLWPGLERRSETPWIARGIAFASSEHRGISRRYSRLPEAHRRVGAHENFYVYRLPFAGSADGDL